MVDFAVFREKSYGEKSKVVGGIPSPIIFCRFELKIVDFHTKFLISGTRPFSDDGNGEGKHAEHDTYAVRNLLFIF